MQVFVVTIRPSDAFQISVRVSDVGLELVEIRMGPSHGAADVGATLRPAEADALIAALEAARGYRPPA